MQHALPCFPSPPAESGVDPLFYVVIAYEDFETGKQAKKTYDVLVETLGSECRFANQMWKFDVLSIPKLREMAGADAAAADLVIVSCHGDELPTHTKEWLECWSASPTPPLALVALFDRPSEEAWRVRPVQEYLAGIARRGNMEFFSQPDTRRRDFYPHDPRRSPDISDQSLRTLSTLAGMVQHDVLRWTVLE